MRKVGNLLASAGTGIAISDADADAAAYLQPPLSFRLPRATAAPSSAINTKNSRGQPLRRDLLHMSSRICQSRNVPSRNRSHLPSRRSVSPSSPAPWSSATYFPEQTPWIIAVRRCYECFSADIRSGCTMQLPRLLDIVLDSSPFTVPSTRSQTDFCAWKSFASRSAVPLDFFIFRIFSHVRALELCHFN